MMATETLSHKTQDVVISDATAPVPDVVNLADVTGECTVTSLTAPTATDNVCAGAITAPTMLTAYQRPGTPHLLPGPMMMATAIPSPKPRM